MLGRRAAGVLGRRADGGITVRLALCFAGGFVTGCLAMVIYRLSRLRTMIASLRRAEAVAASMEAAASGFAGPTDPLTSPGRRGPSGL